MGNLGRRASRAVPSSTFVVRLRTEWSSAGPRWRGRIDHVQSGESACFRSVEAMLEFIRRLTGWQDQERRAGDGG